MLSVTAGFTAAAAAAAEDNQLVVSVATTTDTIVTHFIKCVIIVPFDHDTTRAVFENTYFTFFSY